MKYAGFLKRFLAYLVDGFIIFPITFILIATGLSQSKPIASILIIISCLIGWIYVVYFNARWGQTLGKKAVGIKIATLSGSSIGLKEAILRSSVDGVSVIARIILICVVILHFQASEWESLALADKMYRLKALKPPLLKLTEGLELVWAWSEFVVLLFNDKKRAIHDFIAGTVVVDLSCPKCNKRNELGTKFCQECGIDLAAD